MIKFHCIFLLILATIMPFIQKHNNIKSNWLNEEKT